VLLTSSKFLRLTTHMLSTAVLWHSLYYVRFSWYLSIDNDYRHNFYPDDGACSPDHPVLEYRVIMMSIIDYIQTHEPILDSKLPILDSKLALVVRQVMETHCSMDCFDHVAKHLRAALYKEKKYTKVHRDRSDYSELFVVPVNKNWHICDFVEWTLMCMGGGDNRNFDMIECHERNPHADELCAFFEAWVEVTTADDDVVYWQWVEMEAGR
jgi:hypothetical protein